MIKTKPLFRGINWTKKIDNEEYLCGIKETDISSSLENGIDTLILISLNKSLIEKLKQRYHPKYRLIITSLDAMQNEVSESGLEYFLIQDDVDSFVSLLKDKKLPIIIKKSITQENLEKKIIEENKIKQLPETDYIQAKVFPSVMICLRNLIKEYQNKNDEVTKNPILYLSKELKKLNAKKE